MSPRIPRGGASLLLLFAAIAACGGEDVDPIVADPEEDPCLLSEVPHPSPTQTGNTRHVHDPEIVRDGDAYFVLSTNDGIPIRRSTDLVNWDFVGRVFSEQRPPWAEAEVPGVVAPWAPGVGFFSGRFHLYYSLSTFGSQRSVIGLTTNLTLDPTSPEYAWQDRGKVIESHPGDDYNAIDAAVVLDAEERPWLVWGSWSGGIKMRALDPETGFPSEEDDTEYSLARRPIERALEGPYIVRRGGFYYLFVSFDLCCQGVESTYNVRVGRSEDVTGPYVDRDGIPMLQGGGTLVMSGYGQVRGPGHASVLTENGEYLLVHHFYDASDGGVPHLQIRPLHWDDEGWPLAGASYNGTPPGPPPDHVEIAGLWGLWAGDETARTVELGSDGIARACDGEGTWSYDPPTLTIQWTGIGTTGRQRTDRTILSAGGRDFVGRASDGLIVRGYRLPPFAPM